MSRLSYLLDENVPHAIRDQLVIRQPDIEILVIGDDDAPSLATPDPLILEWLEEHEFVLISRNRRTMPQHLRNHLARGRHIPGIFLIRRRSSMGAVIDDLLLAWDGSDMTEYRDIIQYIPF